MWYWGDNMGWLMIFGSIWLILLLGGTLALIIWGIKKLTERRDTGAGSTTGRNPLDIARERYARGEISKDEFDQLKKDLS